MNFEAEYVFINVKVSLWLRCKKVKNAQNYHFCKWNWRDKMKNQMSKKTDTLVYFIFSEPLAFMTSFFLENLLFFGLYLALIFCEFFCLTLLASNLCFYEIAYYVQIFLIFENMLNTNLVACAFKLQSHHLIIALSQATFL